MTPTSPDSKVLVPSSSPVAASRPSTSKYFAPSSANGSKGSVDASNSKPPFAQVNGKPGSSSVIPSSRLAAVNGTSGTGTPLSVVTAIHQRHAEGGSSPTGPSTSNGPLATPNRPPPSSDPLRLTSATPSPLVHAARQVQWTEDRGLIDRLKMQFPNVRRDIVEATLRRHPGNTDAAIAEIQVLDAAKEAKKNGMDLTPRHDSFGAKPAATSRPPPKVSKPKKNESSRIYANRENQKSSGKRRSQDSESEAEDAGQSEAESEMDWSGDEGRSKKKRKANEEELDAEGAALKAFNEVEADVLTGTIGEFIHHRLSVVLTANSVQSRPGEQDHILAAL